MAELSPQARRFLADHIHSTAELELLLMMRRDAVTGWTAETAGGEMRMPVPWAAGQLATMRASGLLALDAAAECYRYRPAPDLDRTVAEVADAYRIRKTRVVALIFAEPSSDARSFADAFRLRRDD